MTSPAKPFTVRLCRPSVRFDHSAKIAPTARSFTREAVGTVRIANYERALLLDPASRKTRTNLVAARQGIPSTRSNATNGFWSDSLDAVAARLSRSLSPTTSLMLLAAMWTLLWSTVLAGLCLPNRRWRYALIAETCLMLACIAMVGLDHRARTPDTHGIVTIPTAVLRQAPGENFPAVTDQPLPEGQSLTVLRDRESWLQVQTPNGQTGWIAAPQIERVALG